MTKSWELKRRDYDAACYGRREFRQLLAQCHRPADLAAHELVFGELVANAVRHGDEPISVDVVLSDQAVQIRVQNAGDCFNLERLLASAPATTATGGRGLQIVRALVDSLTVDHSPSHSCRVTAVIKISDRGSKAK
jgi:anti-sigma regulatory factor (Ser/Thr protein kinase)